MHRILSLSLETSLHSSRWWMMSWTPPSLIRSLSSAHRLWAAIAIRCPVGPPLESRAVPDRGKMICPRWGGDLPSEGVVVPSDCQVSPLLLPPNGGGQLHFLRGGGWEQAWQGVLGMDSLARSCPRGGGVLHIRYPSFLFKARNRWQVYASLPSGSQQGFVLPSRVPQLHTDER